MQDKDSYYNSSPMKCILLHDIIHHPKFSVDRSQDLKVLLGAMVKDFLNSHKKLNHQMVPEANTIRIDMNSDDERDAFEFAKLHWLIHDFKTNGIAFMPQGILQKTDDAKTFFPEMHPGTFRWFAMFYNKMWDKSIIVADKESYFPDYPILSYEEHTVLCNSGFIRNRKGSYAEIETSNRGEKLFTLHERGNHHDWIILKHLEELEKVFKKVNVYTDSPQGIQRLELLAKDGLEIKILQGNKCTIPSKENFEGVSVYIPESDFMEDLFSIEMFLDLDIDTDVVYYKYNNICIFNNGSAGCKRMISEIVSESKSEYLNNFLWARRVIKK
jgi:hypothetical protein